MNCTICGKPITLVPSAVERARKCGGTPKDYTDLFREHADCAIAKRQRETSELILAMDRAAPRPVVIASGTLKELGYAC